MLVIKDFTELAMRSFTTDSSREDYGWGWHGENSIRLPRLRQDDAQQRREQTVMSAKQFPAVLDHLARDLFGEECYKMFAALSGQAFELANEREAGKKITIKVEPSFLTIESSNGVFLYIRFFDRHALPELRPKKKNLHVQDYYEVFSELGKSDKELFRKIAKTVLEHLPK